MPIDHPVYDNLEWVRNERRNTGAYFQLRNKDDGKFVPNEEGDLYGFRKDLYPDEDLDDC